MHRKIKLEHVFSQGGGMCVHGPKLTDPNILRDELPRFSTFPLQTKVFRNLLTCILASTKLIKLFPAMSVIIA